MAVVGGGVKVLGRYPKEAEVGAPASVTYRLEHEHRDVMHFPCSNLRVLLLEAVLKKLHVVEEKVVGRRSTVVGRLQVFLIHGRRVLGHRCVGQSETLKTNILVGVTTPQT